MPIDFARVPPQVPVPALPRPSKLIWSALLVGVLCLGAALTILLWPAGRPTNTVRFWFYVAGYPVMTWALMLSGYLGFSSIRISQALAINRASEIMEEACHAMAGKPRVMLAHAWCFSCDDQENSAQGIVDGTLRIAPRPSGADPGVDVNARWLQIPDRPFYPGNELTEHSRHRVVCDWLLQRLVEQIGKELAQLPADTFLHVDLCIRSSVELSELHARLEALIRAKAPAIRLKIDASPDHLSLFSIDTWHDRLQPGDAQLLVSIQLCNAISERLPDGAAEAGVAILLGSAGRTRSPATNTPKLHIHRPAIGGPDAAVQTVGLGVRWGQASASQVKTIWSHVPSEDFARPIKAAFSDGAKWVQVDKTIGDCAGTGGWLATALAAEHALLTGEPQLVLSQQGSDMVALICRTQV
ncbi:hypothetical protein [Cupriavidus sp. TMH.W2]|uniref:hypothetical protein n=1 Tax=Cupriavidus sp. TMH.W2 TaxID=3434465 RepID=UPI003D77E192